MLRMYLAKGDAVHVTFPDGTTGIIEAESRGELAFHFPQSVRLTREKEAFKNRLRQIRNSHCRHVCIVGNHTTGNSNATMAIRRPPTL